jgi:hypothetical protein
VTSFNELDFEATARQVYDQFLVLRPQVAVEGLFRVGNLFYIVAPAADDVNSADGLRYWFEQKLAPLAYPIELVGERPENSEEVPVRTRAEVLASYGIVRTRGGLARDLAVALPPSIPYVDAREEDRTAVVRVARPLEAAEAKILERVFEQLGTPMPLRIDAQPPATPISAQRLQTRSGDLALLPSRMLDPAVPIAVRRMVERDEDVWRSRFVSSGTLEPFAVPNSPSERATRACLVGTTFAPANLRTYLSLYSTVFLVAPIAKFLDRTLAALGVPGADLLELTRMGVVRWLAPQSVDRYDYAWLASVVEAAPDRVIASRQLALIGALDQHKRNPLFMFPGNAYDRRAVLRALLRMASEAPGPSSVMLPALATALSEHWAMAEHALQLRGAMSSVVGGLARFAAELGKEVFKQDLFIELGASAQNVEWAGALGAHLVPAVGDAYSSEQADGFTVALSSGMTSKVDTVKARELSLAEELLAFDNDTNVVDFVTDLGRGDLARFRDLVAGFSRGGKSEDDVRALIRDWNGQVRHYERRPDRVAKFSLVGVLLGASSQLSDNEAVRTLVPVIAPFVPMLVTLVNEDAVRESALLGQLVDWANATIAGAAPEAVLLSRMKKRIAGMSDPTR